MMQLLNHTSWPKPGKRAGGIIDGPAGKIEVALSAPREVETPNGVAVICHPHPQHGGTMTNKVVTTLARAANEEGMMAVRFNFRSIGQSEGEYDEGRGEVEDARAVVQWALQAGQWPLRLLAGFSFGSAVALRLADAVSPEKLITVGLPAEYFDDVLPRPAMPWQAVYGEADEVIQVKSAIERVQQLQPQPEMVIMPEVGHFMHGHLTALRENVSQFLASGH